MQRPIEWLWLAQSGDRQATQHLESTYRLKKVLVDGTRHPAGTGTGVMLRGFKFLVTCEHVLRGSVSVTAYPLLASRWIYSQRHSRPTLRWNLLPFVCQTSRSRISSCSETPCLSDVRCKRWATRLTTPIVWQSTARVVSEDSGTVALWRHLCALSSFLAGASTPRLLWRSAHVRKADYVRGTAVPRTLVPGWSRIENHIRRMKPEQSTAIRGTLDAVYTTCLMFGAWAKKLKKFCNL